MSYGASARGHCVASVMFISFSRQLLEAVSGDGRPSAEQTQAVQGVWKLCIHLVKVVNMLPCCIMQVVDKLIERDKEIQQLTETGLCSIFTLCY